MIQGCFFLIEGFKNVEFIIMLEHDVGGRVCTTVCHLEARG